MEKTITGTDEGKAKWNTETALRFPLLQTCIPATIDREMAPPQKESWIEDLRRFLQEDIGPGDVTAQMVLSPEVKIRGRIVARQDLVFCGLFLVPFLFQELSQEIHLQARTQDGESVKQGTVLCELDGPAIPILSGERTALNLMQRLSGIATLTRRYVDAARKGGPAAVLDTRKTTPGLRRLEKYAVACGGGRNHRMGLYDAILIKDNHLVACQGIQRALEKTAVFGAVPVEVEVDSLEQLQTALDCGVAAVLLDNMTPQTVRAAVLRTRGHGSNAQCWLEASGNIRLENIAEYAATGVDGISVGALTHSAVAVDVALDFDWYHLDP